MYHDVLSDPKIQRLPIELRWRWVELLCVASKSKTRGELPSMDDIAYLIRTPKPRAQQIVNAMIENNLIDKVAGQPLRIHDWDQHQRSSDGSAERVRRYRERHGNEPCNGDVTLQKRPRVRPGAGADSETDSETDKSPRKPPKGGGVASFVPPDWIPREPWDAWLESRKRKPTLRALEMAVKKLGALKDLGSEPGAVLEQTVVNGWTGLFEVSVSTKAQRKGEDNGKTSVQQRPEDTVARLKRPDMPRTPEFAAHHQMWDDMESDQRKNGVAS